MISMTGNVVIDLDTEANSNVGTQTPISVHELKQAITDIALNKLPSVVAQVGKAECAPNTADDFARLYAKLNLPDAMQQIRTAAAQRLIDNPRLVVRDVYGGWAEEDDIARAIARIPQDVKPFCFTQIHGDTDDDAIRNFLRAAEERRAEGYSHSVGPANYGLLVAGPTDNFESVRAQYDEAGEDYDVRHGK